MNVDILALESASNIAIKLQRLSKTLTVNFYAGTKQNVSETLQHYQEEVSVTIVKLKEDLRGNK